MGERLEQYANDMAKLVAQRKKERMDMELENERISQQIKYIKEMTVENEEVEAEHQLVSVDPTTPSGNIQVTLEDGSRLVIKLNTDHTVAHIKQEIMARKPEESRRDFKLVTLGPPSKLLLDQAIIGDEKLLGSAIIQRFE